MPNQQIEDLTAISSLALDDEFLVNDVSDTTDDSGGSPKRILAKTLGELFQGYLIDGLVTSNNGTDAAHDIDVASGVASVTDGTNWSIAKLTSSITKQIDATWVVGTNQGGLDTGTVAVDTWYHIFLIMRSDTGVTDILFSTSATSPTMPTNYDYKRRIGAVLTDGSANILAYRQDGDYFYFDETIESINTDPANTNWNLVTLAVPGGVKVKPIGHSFVAGGSNYDSAIWHGDGTPNTSEVLAVRIGRTITSENFPGQIIGQVLTNTSSQIQWKVDNAAVSSFLIYTSGWIDPRGRN